MLGAGLQTCNPPQLSGHISVIEPGQNLGNTFWIFLGSFNFIAFYLFLDKTLKYIFKENLVFIHSHSFL